jgi:MFS family permease
LGYVALFQAIPAIPLSILGGVAADRLDRRRVLMATQTLAALVIGFLGALALTGQIAYWHLLGASFLLGAAQAFDNPSRISLYPGLLPDRSHLPAAVASVAVIFQMNQMVAPAVAGYIIAYLGVSSSFFAAAVAVGVMGALIGLLQDRREGGRPPGDPLKNLAEGGRYLWTSPVYRAVMGLNFLAAFFGMSYALLLPAVAGEVLHVGAGGLGLLTSASGVGALGGIVMTPRLMNRLPAGRVLTGSVAGLGMALLAFAFTSWFPLALAVMVLLGATSYSYLTSIDIIVQTTVPDQLRGRVIAVLLMRWSLVPFGAALLGAVADVVGVPLALGGGALLTVLCSLAVAAASPALRTLPALAPWEAARPAPAASTRPR